MLVFVKVGCYQDKQSSRFQGRNLSRKGTKLLVKRKFVETLPVKANTYPSKVTEMNL